MRPASGFGGEVDRALAVAGRRGRDRRPAPASAAPATAGTDSAVQASISALRPSPSIAVASGTGRGQRIAAPRHGRRARLPASGVRPAPSRACTSAPAAEQRGDDVGMAGVGRLRAGRCGRWPSRVSTLALCLSSSCTPAGSSSSVAAAASSTGWPPGGSGFAPRSSRNLRQAPVAGDAGDRQRASCLRR